MPRLTGLTISLWAAFAAACHDSKSASSPPDMSEGPIQINRIPTGSIQTPSLCERTGVDQRVTQLGVDSFAFLWAGDHYQVVYADVDDSDIFSLSLTPAGAPMGNPVRVATTPGMSSLPALLATPTGYTVAWEDTPNLLQAHTLDATGAPTGSTVPVVTTRSEQIRPVLSTSPYGTVVAWMDQDPGSNANEDDVGTSTTWVGLLDANLALRTDVPKQQVHAAAQSGYPWLAGSSTDLAMMWSETSTQTDVYFGALSSTVTLPSPADIRGTGGVNAALLGRLLRTDFGYIATWEDHRSGEAEIYMSLLDPTGVRYAGGLVEEPATGNANWSHQAWTGAAAGVVYYQFRSGKPQIFMTFIDQTGARIGGAADTQLSNTPASARFPDVQWTGEGFGVLWLDTRDTTVSLYFNHATCKQPAPI